MNSVVPFPSVIEGSATRVEPKAKPPKLRARKQRYAIDWDRIEPDWRANVKSVVQLSEEYGVSRQGIIQHFDKLGIPRDLSAKIHARADALIAQSVDKLIASDNLITEQATIDVNARMIADAVLGQREDVKRALGTVLKLWREVEAQGDHSDAFEKMGELMANPDDQGGDVLLDIYRASISLPQRIKSVKLLTESLKALVELQRRILKVDETPEDPNTLTVTLTDSQRISRIALLIEKART